jgi:hypothetical protein
VARWAAAAALLGGLGLTAGSGAQADSTGTNGQTIFTNIALSGDLYPPGVTHTPLDWVPPKCWLEPNAGLGVDPAYTPDEFAIYMARLNALFHHTQETDLQFKTNQIYYHGVGADPVVGLTKPPYNEGLTGGRWYEIACSLDAVFADYESFKQSLGTTNDYEEWFWFNDGAPPKNVPVVDPELLAEYAAANTNVQPGWPTMSPALDATQTVNLATLISNAAGSNGFRKYQATATLATTGYPPSTVTATPATVTFTSDGPMSPSVVTCAFNADGSLAAGCNLTFLKSTTTGWKLTERTMWNVTWGGDPVTGEPGWTRQIGPFSRTSQPIIVQEIQTVVSHEQSFDLLR